MNKGSQEHTPETLNPQAAQDPIVRWYLGIEWDGLSDKDGEVAVVNIHRHVDTLIGQHQGLGLAADKMRLLVTLMREDVTHLTEPCAEIQYCQLAESILVDLHTAIQ